jgi:hypothetical protein
MVSAQEWRLAVAVMLLMHVEEIQYVQGAETPTGYIQSYLFVSLVSLKNLTST